jgi:hypothetical protein
MNYHLLSESGFVGLKDCRIEENNHTEFSIYIVIAAVEARCGVSRLVNE